MGSARGGIEGLLRSFRARFFVACFPGNRSFHSLIPGLGSLGLSGPNAGEHSLSERRQHSLLGHVALTFMLVFFSAP